MDDRQRLTEIWPLFGLSIRTPRLELRYPTDADVTTLAALSGDIHSADFVPFSGTWSLRPDGERERAILQYHWRQRAEWTPERWRLELVAVVDGAVVGTQAVHGDDFSVTRTVTTGSWLGRAHQGQGVGTEMRAAVLHLAFAALGAERAETDAVEGNGPSLGVTAKLGYRPNGDQVDASHGPPTRVLRFVLDRAGWEAQARRDIEVDGLDPCRALFGLGSPEGDAVA